ncbi:MAG: glycosyltransferase [Chloroflexi bacterium]|nr:glycosyltransferase [Chloroflexota bacterium]MBP8054354.1 glycosyltransferase [Chloroflexota bacterium]
MNTANTLPLVSIIIPTYNRWALLRQTLASVLAQTYPALEIIVVDDGSTDETMTRLTEYAGKVTVIQQSNQGVAAARNQGIRRAQGVYLTFLDDDDLIEPAKITRQAKLLQSQPAIGLVHCGYYLSDKEGRLRDKVWLWPQANPLRQLACHNFIWSGAPLIRRECLTTVGLFDEQLTNGQDWDLWLRLALAGYGFAVIPEPLGTYRLQPDSMVTNLTRLEGAILTVLERTFSHPALPESVAAAKPEAYSGMHLWLSGRGYATGQWEFGQRHLVEALTWRPDWCQQPETLLPLLRNSALDIRVGDPVQWVKDFFTYLPPIAEMLHLYHAQLLGRVYSELALRAYDQEFWTEARQFLRLAAASDPAFVADDPNFVAMITHHAMRLPLSAPERFVDKVMHHLPDERQLWRRLRPRILSQVHLACAFSAYATGQRRDTIRHVLSACRYGPECLKNRGVITIFLKSCWPFTRGSP